MTYRLLKVICQAVLITEDDGELIEHTSQPVAVPVREWLDYPRKMMDQLETMNMEQGLETKSS